MNLNGPIVHLSTAKTWRGGEQQALYLMQGLRDLERDSIAVAQPGSPLAERARAAGFRVEEIKTRGEWDLFAMWRVRGLLRAAGAALVHAHDAHAVALAARAGRWAGVPRICTRRVDFALSGPRKYAGMDRVICISSAIREICLAAGLPAEKLPVVMSGIDTGRIAAAAGDRQRYAEEFFPGEKKPKIILDVASLTDHKGHRYLLEAMPAILAAVPQARLLLVGEGELEEELRRQAKLLALEEAVVFAGFRNDVPALLKSADLFVMSSHLEGLCTSLMDAMAAGLPVVTTRAGGIPEVLGDGQNGVLVPPKDPAALAAAVVDLLENRKQREHFARNAAHRAEKYFHYRNMAAGTLAVYQAL